ncbi:MAG: RNA polymerase sigma factor [Sedimentisphaerales bacterium]|nr:RNA polymerase sigma factor [Sedimentisphaerales bacterium]
MNSENLWSVKVGQACKGSEESVNWLTQQAEGKVRAYIYRVTLDNDLSDDLTQETLLQMIKSIRNLNEEENFWPWLYRIAQSKVQEHYRSKKRETAIAGDSFYKDFLSRRGDIYEDDSLRELLKQDLLKKVMVAMKELKQKQRAVLSLRCFDNLSYAEIADTFDCNEVTARILFYRARKALRKKLSNHGINKNLMIMSLGLFGRLTLSPETSTSIPDGPVSKASLKVGPVATILGNLFSKKTAALLAAIIILLIFLSGRNNQIVSFGPSLPQRNEIYSLHFTMNFQNNTPGAGSQSRGAYEQWFYFPEGVEGPMYMRMQRWDPNTGAKLCTWLNNEHGNYYYDPGSRTLYQWNRRIRWASLKVRRLPSDSDEFANFISKVEGELPVDTTYSRDEKTGMLINSIDHRLTFNAPEYQTTYEYNTLDMEPFINDFPFTLLEIDQRDQMHKRGWTYFNIEGELDGKKITGKGRIPFIYDTCKEYPAWLSINVENELEIVDCNSGAYVRRIDNGDITLYPAGTFFKGLLRPWTGLHTMDAVRRDAVEQRIWYFTELSEDKSDAIITLYNPDKEKSTDMVYTIDVEHDIVEEILVTIDTDIIGSLKFSYLNNIDNVMNEFTEPVMPSNINTDLQELPGILWIADLSHGELGK